MISRFSDLLINCILCLNAIPYPSDSLCSLPQSLLLVSTALSADTMSQYPLSIAFPDSASLARMALKVVAF